MSDEDHTIPNVLVDFVAFKRSSKGRERCDLAHSYSNHVDPTDGGAGLMLDVDRRAFDEEFYKYLVNIRNAAGGCFLSTRNVIKRCALQLAYREIPKPLFAESVVLAHDVELQPIWQALGRVNYE